MATGCNGGASYFPQQTEAVPSFQIKVIGPFNFPYYLPDATVLMLLPESSTHISQAGGQHVVRSRRRPHHHDGSPRLSDPGQYTAVPSVAHCSWTYCELIHTKRYGENEGSIKGWFTSAFTQWDQF